MSLSNLNNLLSTLRENEQLISSLVAEAGAGGALNEEQLQRGKDAALHVAASVVKQVATIHDPTDLSTHLAKIIDDAEPLGDAPQPPGPHADSTVNQGIKSTPTVAQSDSGPATSHDEQVAAVPAAEAVIAEQIATSTAETPQGNAAHDESATTA